MTSEPVQLQSADARLFLPADGLRLLGEHQGSGHAGRQFLVSRSDGQVIQLPLLLYLIMAAIAEGSVDGGWSADQVGARVGAASGQGLTADNVHYLVAGTLVPLGLIAADSADRPGSASPADRANRTDGVNRTDGAPVPARAPRVNPRPGRKTGGRPLRHRAASAVSRVLYWPVFDRLERLLLRYRGRRLALALCGAAVLVSSAAAAPIMTGIENRPRGGASSAAASASAASGPAASASVTSAPAAFAPAASAPSASATSALVSAASAASRSQAAAWVAQQVSPAVTVSCDPGMCRLLRQDGFPAARLEPLPRSARGPLSAGVVVATPAVRDQLGTRLAAYAPQVIASFGSGVVRVAVAAVARDGAAAFTAQLAAEMKTLAAIGRQLLGNRNIQTSPAARSALRAGQVDARLLAILALLSSQLPVRLVSFPRAPGADPGVPLRAAEISVESAASRSAALALLDAQQSPYRPAVAVAVAGGGSRAEIAMQFDAPASLSMSQP